MKKYILPIVMTGTGLVSILSDGCTAVPNVPQENDETAVTYSLTKDANPSVKAIEDSYVAKRSPLTIYEDLLREKGFLKDGKAPEFVESLTNKYKSELLKVRDGCTNYLKDKENKSADKRKQMTELVAKIDVELTRGYPVAIATSLKLKDDKHGDFSASGKGNQSMVDPLSELFQLFLREDKQKADAFGNAVWGTYYQFAIDGFVKEYKLLVPPVPEKQEQPKKPDEGNIPVEKDKPPVKDKQPEQDEQEKE